MGNWKRVLYMNRDQHKPKEANNWNKSDYWRRCDEIDQIVERFPLYSQGQFQDGVIIWTAVKFPVYSGYCNAIFFSIFCNKSKDLCAPVELQLLRILGPETIFEK